MRDLVSWLTFIVTTLLATSAFAVDTAEWTVMIFMNGDNDLESAALDDFNEMAKVSLPSSVNVLVQFDRHPGYSSDFGDWAKTLRFKMRQGISPVEADKLADLGELNMASGQVLADFVSWAMKNYPARRFALIMWDHGLGWRLLSIGNSPAASNPVRAVSRDDTSANAVMMNRDMQDSLLRALRGRHLDLIGFDACLMQMLETAYGLRNVGDVMVGSEDNVPGPGWRYDLWLGGLSAKPLMKAEELGLLLVQAYAATYPTPPAEVRNVTLSAIRLNSVKALAETLSAFADLLVKKLTIPEAAKVISVARAQRSEFGYDPRYPSNVLTGIDLYKFVESVTLAFDPTDAVATTGQKLLARLAFGITIRSSSSPPGSLGLSIYFPRNATIYRNDPDGYAYNDLNFWYPIEFVRAYNWDRFLHAYFRYNP